MWFYLDGWDPFSMVYYPFQAYVQLLSQIALCDFLSHFCSFYLNSYFWFWLMISVFTFVFTPWIFVFVIFFKLKNVFARDCIYLITFSWKNILLLHLLTCFGWTGLWRVRSGKFYFVNMFFISCPLLSLFLSILDSWRRSVKDGYQRILDYKVLSGDDSRKKRSDNKLQLWTLVFLALLSFSFLSSLSLFPSLHFQIYLAFSEFLFREGLGAYFL